MNEMQVDQEIRRFVETVAAITPEAPLVTPVRKERRSPAPLMAIAGGFTAVLLVLGLSSLVLVQESKTARSVGAESPAEILDYDAGDPLDDFILDTENAIVLRSLVDAALADAGVGLTVTKAVAERRDLSDGGMVHVAVLDEEGFLVISVDYQGITDAQRESETGSPTDTIVENLVSVPGESTRYGTLRVDADAPTPIASLRTDEGELIFAVIQERMHVRLTADTLRAITLQIGAGLDRLAR